jgi:hypothetical protein
MILEVAILNVRSGQEVEFERAFAQAAPIISSMTGYVSHELQRCIETPHRYVLLVHWETLETGKSREVGFRVGNLAGTIYIVAKRTDLRRAFLGALAASRLGAHPEANRVQVDIEDWVMPTMAEYRLGARPRWRSLHDATFLRRSSGPP